MRFPSILFLSIIRPFFPYFIFRQYSGTPCISPQISYPRHDYPDNVFPCTLSTTIGIYMIMYYMCTFHHVPLAFPTSEPPRVTSIPLLARFHFEIHAFPLGVDIFELNVSPLCDSTWVVRVYIQLGVLSLSTGCFQSVSAVSCSCYSEYSCGVLVNIYQNLDPEIPELDPDLERLRELHTQALSGSHSSGSCVRAGEL